MQSSEKYVLFDVKEKLTSGNSDGNTRVNEAIENASNPSKSTTDQIVVSDSLHFERPSQLTRSAAFPQAQSLYRKKQEKSTSQHSGKQKRNSDGGIISAVNVSQGITSNMKTSFSMTSLPLKKQERQEAIRVKLRTERPYNSLKKNTVRGITYNSINKASVNTNNSKHRYSWGSGYSSSSLHSSATFGFGSGKDDFWAAIQTNYNYIMDTNLLDTCKEARNEMESFGNAMQNPIKNSLKAVETSQHCELFFEGPDKLRKWLSEMENKMEKAPSLSEAMMLNISELRRSLTDHSVLYQEVVSHGRLVNACIRTAAEKEQQYQETPQPIQISMDNDSTSNSRKIPEKTSSKINVELEKTTNHLTLSSHLALSPDTARKYSGETLNELQNRYHLLYLKALEVQLWLDGLLRKKIASEDFRDELDGGKCENDFFSPIQEYLTTNGSLQACNRTSIKTALADTTTSTDFEGDSESSDYETSSNVNRSSGRSKLRKRQYLQILQQTQSIAPDDINELEILSQNVQLNRKKLLSSNLRSNKLAMPDSKGKFYELSSQKSKLSIKPVIVTSTHLDSKKNNPVQIATTDFTDLLQQNELQSMRFENFGNEPAKVQNYDIISQIQASKEQNFSRNHKDSSQSYSTDTSKFNHSNRKSKNCAIFYFKHMDTDSDHNFTDDPLSSATSQNNDVKGSLESIKQLVLEAEHLVRHEDILKTPTNTEYRSTRNSNTDEKHDEIMPDSPKQRVQNWLKCQKSIVISGKKNEKAEIVNHAEYQMYENSGDASDTESVIRPASENSGGFTESVATCMQTSLTSSENSSDIISESLPEPIAVLSTEQTAQSKDSNSSVNAASSQNILKQRNFDRRWSVSCLPRDETSLYNAVRIDSTHSVSDSALDSSFGQRYLNTCVRYGSQIKNNSSLKRRKSRKKKLFNSVTISSEKKIDSCSEKTIENQKIKKNSSTKLYIKQTSDKLCMQIPKFEKVTGLQSKVQKKLDFRVGGCTTRCMASEPHLKSLGALSAYIINDELQGECTTGTEDHLSSFSETAWDNYQEKYNSENYSEGFDSDAARRIMEFGDDYHNFIDSQSDCCSSLSANNNLVSQSTRKDASQHCGTGVPVLKTVHFNKEKNRMHSSYDICNETQPAVSMHSVALNESFHKKLDVKHSVFTPSDNNEITNKHGTKVGRAFKSINKSNIFLVPPFNVPYSEDERDVFNFLAKSGNRFEATEALKTRCHYLSIEDYEEIITTCRENIRCLDIVLQGVSNSSISNKCADKTKGLRSSWETLLAWSENAASARMIQEEVTALKASLKRMGHAPKLEIADTEHAIQNAIESLTNEKLLLQDHRQNMLHLNASVHSWLTRQERKLQNTYLEQKPKTKNRKQKGEISNFESMKSDSFHIETATKPSVAQSPISLDKSICNLDGRKLSDSDFHNFLRNEVSEMYSEWNGANERINVQLELLSNSLQTWRQLDSGLFEFEKALSYDRGTLKNLQGVLDSADVTKTELHKNVQKFAGILSDKFPVNQTQHLNYLLDLSRPSASNGSLSDSGISDGGANSDNGLSGRERRLGILRRLARHLESALSPGSVATHLIEARIKSAEGELKQLQKACRDLIIRTAITEHEKNQVLEALQREARERDYITSEEPLYNNVQVHFGDTTDVSTACTELYCNENRDKNSKALKKESTCSTNCILSTSTVPAFELISYKNKLQEQKGNKGLWRLLKFILPTQVALLTFISTVLMVQPNCCENFNSFSVSFVPQLHYLGGPPPF